VQLLTTVGFAVGLFDGEVVGLLDGDTVGDLLGAFDGSGFKDDGDPVGVAEGLML